MFSPLQVEIRPSAIGKRVFLLLTVLSIYSVWISGLTLSLKIPLTFICSGYLIYCWPRFIALTHHRSVTGLRWLADKKVGAICLAGNWAEIETVQQRLTFPMLLGLSVKLREQRGSVAVVIWPDSVSADQFRKLRVLLRFATPISANHN